MFLGNNFTNNLINFGDLPQPEQDYLNSIGFKAEGTKDDISVMFRAADGSFSIVTDGYISMDAVKNFADAPGSLWIPWCAVDLKHSHVMHSYLNDATPKDKSNVDEPVGAVPIMMPCRKGETEFRFYEAFKRITSRMIFAYNDTYQKRYIMRGTLDLIGQEKPKSQENVFPIIQEGGEAFFIGFSVDEINRRFTAIWEWNFNNICECFLFHFVPQCHSGDMTDCLVGTYTVIGKGLGLSVDCYSYGCYKKSDVSCASDITLVDMVRTIADIQAIYG